MEKRYN